MAGETIVIVDDEPRTVDMFVSFLSMKGYTVHGAYGGEEGVAVVQMEQPALLLLDLMMPDMDGFQVCRELRAQPAFAALPIVIVSARTDEQAKADALAAGATSYVTKPVRFPELLTVIEQYLG